MEDQAGAWEGHAPTFLREGGRAFVAEAESVREDQARMRSSDEKSEEAVSEEAALSEQIGVSGKTELPEEAEMSEESQAEKMSSEEEISEIEVRKEAEDSTVL